jgi:hypothetical protein
MWQPVFSYLEHEARFQAAAATATGAAAAWWLKSLLSPGKDAPPLPHPLASRIAATLLTTSSFLFLVTEGRLSAQYGQLARFLALKQDVPTKWAAAMVRDVHDSDVLLAWWPYYFARGLLLVVGAILVWSLFSGSMKRGAGKSGS